MFPVLSFLTKFVFCQLWMGHFLLVSILVKTNNYLLHSLHSFFPSFANYCSLMCSLLHYKIFILCWLPVAVDTNEHMWAFTIFSFAHVQDLFNFCMSGDPLDQGALSLLGNPLNNNNNNSSCVSVKWWMVT